jgi:ABC-type antimicrobial peptide transport system permease subunit
MSRLASVVRMVAQRALGHWRLFAAMLVGSLLCGSLLASVVLYSDSVRDLGLAHALKTQPEFAVDARVLSTSQRFTGREYDKLKGTTDSLIVAHTTGFRRDFIHYGRSATFFPVDPGDAVSTDDKRLRAHFQYLDRLDQHTRIVEGRAPAPAPPANEATAPVIEVALGAEIAREQGVSLGREFDLFPHWRKVDPIRVKVVGLIEPNDLTEEYWFGRTDRFKLSGNPWATLPFFVDETTIVRAVGGYLADLDGTLETFIFTDLGAINSSNARQVESRVGALKDDVRSQLPLTNAETELDRTIKNYREKLFFTRLPLFALMIQIVGVVLFYLVMVSTMVVEKQQGEIALLKSRGAGTRQVLSVFFIEGLGISLIATAVGPFIAWGFIALLGLTPSFEELSNGNLIDVRLTALSFAFAGIGGLLSLIALMWPAWRACRYSITNYKQQISRPSQQPVFLRYYLDLVLVAIGAFLFYQLRDRGSFVTEGLFGDLSADPVLLASPTLFMLMIALVFLRLFPLALRGVLFLTRRFSGPTASLALTRMARSPLQHSRLILLLLLATAVGMFAAGFRSTLERGYEHRAAYKAGAEARLQDVRQPAAVPAPQFASTIEAATQSTDVCPVIRASGFYSPARFRSDSIVMLGVCSATPGSDGKPGRPGFADLAFWRDDFAGEGIEALVERTRLPAVESPPAVAVPSNARYIGLWALSPLAPTAAPLGIRLRDKAGAIWEYRLFPESQQVPLDQFNFWVADLTRPFGTRPSGPAPTAADRQWKVEAIFVALPGAPPQVSQQVNMIIDDLSYTSATTLSPGWGKTGLPDAQVLDTFEDISAYELVKGVSQTGDPGALSRAPNARNGAGIGLRFIRGRTGTGLVSIRATREAGPLPVIANGKYLDKSDIKVGSEIPMYINSQYINVKIVGRFTLFPSFDPDVTEALFVADLESLRAAATRVPGAGSNFYPNEAWIGQPGAGITWTKDGLKEKGLQVETIALRQAIFEEQSRDPLVAASWEGILFISFAAVLLVSALGFITYSGLGAQTRSLEFAILRTMGLSGRQIFGVVSFEQAFVVLGGVAAGTLLGFPLSRLMISYMGLTEQGKTPLPPLQSVINWQSVLTVYVLLGIVVVVTVITLVVLYSRLAVSRALRMGEL